MTKQHDVTANGNGNNVSKNVKMQVKSIGNAVCTNAPSVCEQVNDLKQVFEIIEQFSPLTVENGYMVNASGCYYSPFGHGGTKNVSKIANNAQIDRAICQGFDTLNMLVLRTNTPSRVCNRYNDNDYHSKPETDNCLNGKYNIDLKMNHLGFLAGKSNAKNTLQKRLFNVMPNATIDQLNEIAQQIHAVAAPLAKMAERVYNTRYNKKQHKFADYCDGGEYGTVVKSLNSL